MKQVFGMSQNGNLREAANALTNPQFIMLLSNQTQFEQHVRELEQLFPGVVFERHIYGKCPAIL